MDDVDLPRRSLEPRKPAEDFVTVGMRRETIERDDRGAHANALAVDADLAGALLQCTASRTGRLESRQEYGGVLVREADLQMVEDAPARRHSARGDDDHRSPPA